MIKRLRLRRLRARAIPSPLGPCGWLPPRAQPPTVRRLEGTEVFDCAIVGAGFVGLAAAQRLAELRPEWRIAVVEAQTAGQGASGRSSGFLVDAASFIAAMPTAEADAFVRLSRSGMEALRSRVAAHEIDCDWDEHGFFHAAATDVGLASLETLTAWLADRGADHEVLEPDALEAAIGTDFYRRAVRVPGNIMVDAGRLVRGLAGALRSNVTLYERSPVTRIEPDYKLTTPSGSLLAPRLVVAINAWSPSLGVVKRRVLPLLTFGSLTRPLTADEQRQVGEEQGWGVLAQDPVGASLRRTRDQRLLVRGGLAYDRDVALRGDQLARAEATNRQSLARRFPGLADVPFETTWAGPMGAVPSQRPFIGVIARRAYAIAGFTGAGIAVGTTLGRLAAERLAGVKSESLGDARRLARPRKLPPEPFLSLGIRWRVRKMNRLAGVP